MVIADHGPRCIYLLVGTRFGAQVRASVDNATAAAGLGINVNLVFAVTFALGSGLAGLGGGLGIDVLGLDPTFPLKYMVYFLLVVAVGGAGTIKGALVAAMILGVFDVAGKYYVPQIGAFVIYVLMVDPVVAVSRRACSGGAREPCERGARRPFRPGKRPRDAAAQRSLATAGDRLLAACRSSRTSLFPDYLVLGSQILIVGLFAVSLDLILGLRRHRVARPRRLLRRRRVYRGLAGGARLGRAAQRTAGCRRGRGHRRIPGELSRGARTGPARA